MLSAAEMQIFKNGLLKIVNPANIVDDPDGLQEYSHDHSFVRKAGPFLIVYPENTGEIQSIVRLALETNVPLVPVSSGPPRLNGDTVPEQGGAVINFNKMKRIINIDSVNRCAMIEPGVTYAEIVPELKKHGLKLISPLLTRQSKSVAASRLEREPLLVPKYQYDYLDPLLTAEVAYGTGDVFRTGSASGPGTLETLKADKVNPWGPGQIDYIRFLSGAQGTMGLVTWLMTKVEVLPALQKLYFISSENLRPLIEAMNLMLRRRIGDECLILNNSSLATILAEDWPRGYYELKTDLPNWTLMVSVSGYQRLPEERIHLQEEVLQDICTSFHLQPKLTLTEAKGMENGLLDLLSSPWNKEPYWKLRLKNSCRNIFCLSPFSKITELTEHMSKVASKYPYSASDIGCYVQPLVQGRGCHVEFIIPCQESDPVEMQTVLDLFMDASETLFRNGAYFSRPYGPWAKMVYENHASEVVAFNKLKKIFDPAGILNPGKLCF